MIPPRFIKSEEDIKATLREITESIIEDIEYVLKLAGPLASGDPIPDTSIYHLDDFPEAG